jgi:hypothetical protein
VPQLDCGSIVRSVVSELSHPTGGDGFEMGSVSPNSNPAHARVPAFFTGSGLQAAALAGRLGSAKWSYIMDHPIDRIIAATGRAFGSNIMRDGDLMLCARAGHIEAIACRSLGPRDAGTPGGGLHLPCARWLRTDKFRCNSAVRPFNSPVRSAKFRCLAG